MTAESTDRKLPPKQLPPLANSPRCIPEEIPLGSNQAPRDCTGSPLQVIPLSDRGVLGSNRSNTSKPGSKPGSGHPSARSHGSGRRHGSGRDRSQQSSERHEEGPAAAKGHGSHRSDASSRSGAKGHDSHRSEASSRSGAKVVPFSDILTASAREEAEACVKDTITDPVKHPSAHSHTSAQSASTPALIHRNSQAASTPALLKFSSKDPAPPAKQNGNNNTGAGVTCASGQWAQAKDRDFDKAFRRCKTSTENVKQTAAGSRCCVKTQQALAEVVGHAEAMLENTQHLFDYNTAKTIVSLNQLATELEAAAVCSAQYSKAPFFSFFFCCGAEEGRQSSGDEKLHRAAQSVEAYSTSMLLEHGFRASDFRLFVERCRHSQKDGTMRSGSVRGGSVVGGSVVGGSVVGGIVWTPEGLKTPAAGAEATSTAGTPLDVEDASNDSFGTRLQAQFQSSTDGGANNMGMILS